MKLPVARPNVAKLALLMLCAGLAVWFLCPPDPPVWRLRTIFHIGRAPDPILVLEGWPHPQATVERHYAVVSLISSPGFRQIIADTSEFEPNSAALSKRLVFATLRPHALNDNDVDVEIDLTAASAADCRAAYRNIAGRILQRHALLFDQKAKLLQAAIDDYQERATQLAKWDVDGPRSDIAVRWNETRELLRELEAIKSIMSPTTFPSEAEVYIYGPITNNTVRISALTGLAVVLCALLLGLGLESYPSNRRNIKT